MKHIVPFFLFCFIFSYNSYSQDCSSGGIPCSGGVFVDVCTVDCPPGQTGIITLVYVCDGAGGIIDVDIDNQCLLPVEFGDLKVELIRDGEVMVKWTTLIETNNESFELQRSYDGLIFKTVSRTSGQGNSSEESSYTLMDREVDTKQKTVYYRVRQNDYDGFYSFSEVVSTRLNTRDVLISHISQNDYSIEFELNAPQDQTVEVALFDMSGNLYRNMSQLLVEGNNHISIVKNDLFMGIYVLNIISNEKMISRKFVIY